MIETEDVKVSIIIPVYNVEKYLDECLDSAVSQTHKNKEIIAINDGSTDGSAKILDRYQKKFKEIRVVTTENRGQSCARNTGLDIATGDYIIFLDSDDWIEEKTLKECIIASKKFQSDIVFFNAEAFPDGVPESEAKKFKYTRPEEIYCRNLSTIKAFEVFVRENNYIVQPCCYIYKRSAFSEVRFSPGILHEDNLFTTQLLLANPSATAVCLPERFFHRRVRPGSIMTQAKSIKHVEGYFSVAEELLKNEIAQRKSSLSRALNHFIQFMISAANHSALSAFGGRVPFKTRVRSIDLLLKCNFRYLHPLRVLICLLPELIWVKRLFKRG